MDGVNNERLDELDDRNQLIDMNAKWQMCARTFFNASFFSRFHGHQIPESCHLIQMAQLLLLVCSLAPTKNGLVFAQLNYERSRKPAVFVTPFCLRA